MKALPNHFALNKGQYQRPETENVGKPGKFKRAVNTIFFFSFKSFFLKTHKRWKKFFELERGFKKRLQIYFLLLMFFWKKIFLGKRSKILIFGKNQFCLKMLGGKTSLFFLDAKESLKNCNKVFFLQLFFFFIFFKIFFLQTRKRRRKQNFLNIKLWVLTKKSKKTQV